MTEPTTSTDTLLVLEAAIRDFAASVISSVRARREHPTYGYTKTKIRERAARMEGVIAAYQVLTDPDVNVFGVLTQPVVSFSESATAVRVNEARDALKTL